MEYLQMVCFNCFASERHQSPAGQDFWHPDPVMPHDILPRPGPNPKKVNFMAPTWTNPIIFQPIRTGSKHIIINSKLDRFGYSKPVNMTRNENITSYNMLLSVLYQLCLLTLGMRYIYFRNSLEKIYNTPVKNTPTRTGPKAFFPT